jgi:serine/threonine-protein kinase
MDNYIGMKLDGRYELLELIGTGGMAEIYKADDTVEEKTVAVKILKNEFAGSEEFLRRFRNESKAIALLSHTNIVKIFDVGFTDSVQFIVMEYIDGITLIDYIEKQGVLKWREALGFVRQILKALQHAHDRGIVHRDVKSQNCMLLRDGTIKVMDFGIARFNREIDKTMSEKAIGSVHYISPEQARGDITDEKSDLYSVGVMLYEMLTGVKPFDGNDALAIALMHTNKNPKRPMEVNASIPEGLEEITLRAMQKEPVKRYQTAGEMLNDVAEFEKNPSIIFEYKYSTPDGNTKYFDKIGGAVTNPAAGARAQAVAPVSPALDNNFYDDDEYDDEIAERHSPLLSILFAVASAVVVVAAVVVALVFGGVIGDGANPFSRSEEVPDFVDMTWTEVQAQYGDMFTINPRYEPSEKTAGTVLRQNIRAGSKINPNQTVIEVIVSSGEQVYFFPDFGDPETDWLTADYVLKILREDLKLMVTTRSIYHDKIPAAHFVRADKKTGDRVAPGDGVTVFISMGSGVGVDTTNVRDFIGITEQNARDIATESRITLNVEYEHSAAVEAGRVIRQDTPVHTVIANFAVVTITVSLGVEENLTRDFSIVFEVDTDIPSSWAGRYDFHRYEGTNHIETISSQYIEGGTVISWTVSGTESHEFSLRISKPGSSVEVLYARYAVDFSTEPVTASRTAGISSYSVLQQLNQSTVQGTPAPATTADDYNPNEPGDFR